MKKVIIIFTLLITALLTGCQNSSVVQRIVPEAEMLESEDYDLGIDSLNSGNYDEAISYFNQFNNETSKELISNIKHHRLVDRYYENAEYQKAQDEALLITEPYPKYDEIKKLLNELPTLVKNENIKEAERKFEHAKEAFSKEYYRTAYNYLQEVIKLQPDHNEALQLVDTYKAKHEEDIIAKEKEQELKKEQSKTENINTATVSADTIKSEFEEMILKALTGLASKAYFNSENDFIIEVDSSEWDSLSENEQKDILYLFEEYIGTLRESLGDNSVSGFGAVFSEAGRQLESFYK